MPVKNEPLLCKCGNEFGRAYVVDSVFVGAQVGSLLVDEALHGKCVCCGRGIHLVVNRKAYIKLMSRYGEASPFVLEFSENV